MSACLQKIAILGRGLPLAMSAAILANSLKPFAIEVLVIELPADPHMPMAEATGPEFSGLCRILGLDEREIIRRCQGTFRLGSQYQGETQRWFVPFAHLGMSAGQDEFEQALFQTLKVQSDADLDLWSIAAVAAKAGKFAIAGQDRLDLRQALDYGVHLDAKAYCQILQAYCQKLNVTWHAIDDNQLSLQHNEQGELLTCRLPHTTLSADFWVDLSHESYLSASQDSLVNVSAHTKECRPRLPIRHSTQWMSAQQAFDQPCSQFMHFSGGWLKQIPLRSGTYYQCFSSTAAWPTVEAQIRSLIADAPEHLVWQALQCESIVEPWQHNCLSLGQVAKPCGGMVFSELQIVQAALVQFLDLFPDLPIGENNRRHFNVRWQDFAQEAYDFSLAHFVQSGAEVDTTSMTLTQRMQVFARLGRLEPLLSDATTEGQWYHLLFGLGLRPFLPSVVLSNEDTPSLQHKLSKVRQTIERLVHGMPSHRDYLAQFYPLTMVSDVKHNE
jgi:tryptophan 7-halogenase